MESANNEILDQVRKLNQKFSQIEVENSAVKQINSLLSKRLVDTERHCGKNGQYPRRECLLSGGYSKCLPFSKRLVVKYLHVTLRHAIVLTMAK